MKIIRRNKTFHTTPRLMAATAELIEAYANLYKEEPEIEQQPRTKRPVPHSRQQAAKNKPPTTDDESVLALARMVGDRRVRKSGVVETTRRH